MFAYFDFRRAGDVEELAKLAALPNLVDVVFHGNPFRGEMDKEEYRKVRLFNFKNMR